MIEQQPILAAAGDGVQGPAYAPQEGLTGQQLAVFVVGQEAQLRQLVQAAGVEVPFGDPAHHLDVAQSAGAAFYVGFQIVGGVVVAMMPLRLLLEFGLEKRRRRPDVIRPDRFDASARTAVAARRADAIPSASSPR